MFLKLDSETAAAVFYAIQELVSSTEPVVKPSSKLIEKD